MPTTYGQDGQQKKPATQDRVLKPQFTAIPTRYNGVQFRSRLEARWACMFDLLRWKWEYEPFERQGWIPDFVLPGTHQNTLVEVKPTIAGVDIEKVCVPGYETLCLSAMPFTDFGADQDSGHFLGEWDIKSSMEDWPLFGFLVGGECNGWFSLDHAVLTSEDGTAYDFRAHAGSFAHRIDGTYSGDHHLHWAQKNRVRLRAEVEDMWKRAGAETQWKAVR